MSSPPRSSRFIEGSPSTRPDLLARTSTSNELFYNILSEMDEFESKRKHRGSRSSVDSLPSSNGSSPTNTSHPNYPTHTSPTKPGSSGFVVDRSHTVKEGRRSINFTRSSMDREVDGRRRRSGSGSDIDAEGHSGDKLAKKFVGRLRALTGGKERDVKSYTAT